MNEESLKEKIIENEEFIKEKEIENNEREDEKLNYKKLNLIIGFIIIVIVIVIILSIFLIFKNPMKPEIIRGSTIGPK